MLDVSCGVGLGNWLGYRIECWLMCRLRWHLQCWAWELARISDWMLVDVSAEMSVALSSIGIGSDIGLNVG